MEKEKEQEYEDRFQLNEAADFVRRAKANTDFDVVSYKITLAAGDLVFREGDIGDAMYVIMEGEVLILKKLEDGSSRVLHTMRKGDFFGEMSLIDKKTRSASALCQGPTTLVRIPEGLLVHFIEKNPQFVIKMLNTFVERIRHSNKIIERAMIRNPQGIVLDGLQDFLHSKGLDHPQGSWVDVEEFASWAHYRLGIPELQMPTLIDSMVRDKVLRSGARPGEVFYQPNR